MATPMASSPINVHVQIPPTVPWAFNTGDPLLPGWGGSVKRMVNTRVPSLAISASRTCPLVLQRLGMAEIWPKPSTRIASPVRGSEPIASGGNTGADPSGLRVRGRRGPPAVCSDRGT
jgi:hypothetical protein